MPPDPLLDRFKLPGAGGGSAQAAAAAAAALSPFLGLPPPFNLPTFMPPPPPPPTSSSMAAAQNTKDAAAAVPPLNPFASMDHLSLLNLARSASALQQQQHQQQQQQQQQQSLSPPKSKSPKSPKRTGKRFNTIFSVIIRDTEQCYSKALTMLTPSSSYLP